MANLTYFKKFSTKSDYDTYIDGTPVLPNVSIVGESDVYFKDEEGPTPPTPPQDYLTFNIINAGTIVWKMFNQTSAQAISYSKDNGETWEDITSTPEGTIINVETGDKIMFKGDNPSYGKNSGRNTFSGSTAKFEAEGNIMSLIDSENFATATTLVSSYTFFCLFSYCTGLTSAENLVLPATTLVDSCYQYMFQGCTSLTKAPELPATTLASSCYSGMFEGCTSLTTVPSILPATILAEDCYYGMFDGCTSLTTAPELPAITLANGCYQYMFEGCTSLTTVPSILPATTLARYCYDSMFYDCVSLITAPELPATTLAHRCYLKMFYGCNSLNYIKCLATDISAEECTDCWVGSMGSGSGSGSGGGVSPTGTFVKAASMNDWSSKDSGAGIPDGWDVQDAS